MKFLDTALAGAFLVEMEAFEDDRGFFARTFCRDEFARHGLNTAVAQCNLSYNRHRGTLRGMHYQVEPAAEAKLVQCTKGSIFDVIIDLCPESPTCGEWYSVELNDRDRRLLYIPEGFAHGFQTMVDDTAVYYQMSEFYKPEFARGVRWNDPAFGIKWPIPEPILSARDRQLPDYR